jgi:hypothetical protein
VSICGSSASGAYGKGGRENAITVGFKVINRAQK